MPALPIKTYNLLCTPETGAGNPDGYRWRVWLEEDVPLLVELGGSQAITTGLGRSGLHAELPAALQRYANGKLTTDRPVLDQVTGWNSPIVLSAEHFQP